MGWTLRKLIRTIILIFRTFGAQRHAIPLFPVNDGRGRRHESMSTGLSKPKQSGKQLSILDLSEPGRRELIMKRVHDRLKYPTEEAQTESLAPNRSISKDCFRSLPASVIAILSNPPWVRTQTDAQKACQALQICKSFCDYPPHIQKILCRIGWYQWLEKGRVILKEGHPASGFYFLLSGSVVIYQKRSSDELEIINTLEEGHAFGEFALMNDTKRTTTCVASTPVEVFVIGKSDYVDLSLRQVKLSYQRAMYLDSCRTISVLRAFPLQYLQDQSDICRLTYYKPGTVVVKDSNKSDWIFIVINGSCQVMKKFVKSVASSQDKQYHLQRTANIYSQSQVKQIPGHVKAENYPAKHKDSSGKPSKKLLVQLQRLHSKDVFGLSTLVYGDEPSVTLVSNGAELIEISKLFIKSYIDEGTLAMLRKEVYKYPSQAVMERRIREHHSWSIYKETLVNRLKRN